MNTLVEQERKLMDLLTRRVRQTFADARAAGVPAEVSTMSSRSSVP